MQTAIGIQVVFVLIADVIYKYQVKPIIEMKAANVKNLQR